jgi:hypothetical protein
MLPFSYSCVVDIGPHDDMESPSSLTLHDSLLILDPAKVLDRECVPSHIVW